MDFMIQRELLSAKRNQQNSGQQQGKTQAGANNNTQQFMNDPSFQWRHQFFEAAQQNAVFGQAKLEIGKPNDKFEQEADAVADKVVGNQNGKPGVQKMGAEEEGAMKPIQRQEEEEAQQGAMKPIQRQEEEEAQQGAMKPIQKMEEEEGAMKPIQKMEEEEGAMKPIQRQEEEEGAMKPIQKMEEEEGAMKPIQRQEEEEGAMKPIQKMEEEEGAMKPLQREEEEKGAMKSQQGMGGTASGSLENKVKSSKGSGKELDGHTKANMESGMGANFDDVRIHTDGNAQEMTKEIQAQAFTVGNDIYFNQGKYDPNSTDGQRLLAHELTHTVQQGASAQKKEQQ